MKTAFRCMTISEDSPNLVILLAPTGFRSKGGAYSEVFAWVGSGITAG